jgi:hypothetical protein
MLGVANGKDLPGNRASRRYPWLLFRKRPEPCLDRVVGTALRYRLFRIGKMPPALRTASNSADVLRTAEGVSVKISGRSIALPGVRSGRSLQLAVGSIVLSPSRLLAAVGAWVILDTGFVGMPDTGHTVAFSEEGMHLHVSVPKVYQGGRGTFDLQFRVNLDQSALARLPSTTLAVRLPEGIAPLVRRWA